MGVVGGFRNGVWLLLMRSHSFRLNHRMLSDAGFGLIRRTDSSDVMHNALKGGSRLIQFVEPSDESVNRQPQGPLALVDWVKAMASIRHRKNDDSGE